MLVFLPGLPGRGLRRASSSARTPSSWPAGPTSWSRSTSPSGGRLQSCACERSRSCTGGAATGATSCSELASPIPSSWRPSLATCCPAWRRRRGPSARPRSATPARWGATSARLRPPVTLAGARRPRRQDRPRFKKRAPRASASRNSSSARSGQLLQPGEIIVAVRLPARLGSQEFLKVGHAQRHGHRRRQCRPRGRLGRPNGPMRPRLGRACRDPGPRSRGLHLLQDRLGRTEAPPRRRPGRVHRPRARRGAADRRPPLHGGLPPPRRR